MTDLVFFKALLDLFFHLFNCCCFQFAGIDMSIQYMDVRTETPEMDVMHSVQLP